MTWLLLAAGLAVAAGLGLAGAVCLPGTRWRAGLDPRVRARWAAAGLAGAVALTYAGLVLLAVPAVAGVLPQSALAAWPRLLAGPGPGGTAVAWLAAGLLAASAGVVTAQAWRASRQRRMLRVEPDIGTHEHRDGFDLVTLPRAAPVAYSLGGHRPQVVVSQGLRDRLDGGGLAAVLAHEAAHLRAGHDRWLHLARAAEAALWFAPWARPAAGALRLWLERWADEDAARQVGRPALRAALLTAAGIEPATPMAAALSGAGALAERITALAAGPPDGAGGLRAAAPLAVTAMTAVAGAGALVAALGVLAHLCAA
jgi:Zn-dependent protease with chaperone function